MRINLFILLFIYVASGWAAPTFDNPVWDFGTIYEKEGMISHTFRFTNDSEQPFVIERISVFCGCTIPEYSKQPYRKGETGTIKVFFNPSSMSGSVLKTIVVVTDGGKNTTKLTMKGCVIPKTETVARVFPYELIPGIRFTSQSLDFGQIGKEQSKTKVIGYVNTTEKEIEVELIIKEKQSPFSIQSKLIICAGCKGNIAVTIDPNKLSAGSHAVSDEIELLCTSQKGSGNIAVSASL